MRQVDVVVVGGGIVGLASALAVLALRPGASVRVLEKEWTLAAHQTGRNSGVIHAGLYYKPRSVKAVTCARGRRLLEQFCTKHSVAFERCGKLVVAAHAAEVPRLEELERRGLANGLRVERLSADALREREPHARGVAALFVPETGIVDYGAVARAYAAEIVRRGGDIAYGARVVGVRPRPRSVLVEHAQGAEEARVVVSCAGLQSDRVAAMAGVRAGVAIVPFRGEYWMLAPERTHLVRALIYPVPDPAFPFLGVHFTRRLGGGVEAGPNAVLALAREGYTRTSFDPYDTLDLARWPGFWRLAARHWHAAAREQWRSLSRVAFARACAALVPEIQPEDLVAGGAGVRAQAISRDGTLVDDFAFAEGERMVHLMNAPSPAATASLAVGEEIARRAARWL
jgi:L-2-hydroxyglutarate oxidase LhgO